MTWFRTQINFVQRKSPTNFFVHFCKVLTSAPRPWNNGRSVSLVYGDFVHKFLISALAREYLRIRLFSDASFNDSL